MKTAIVIVKMLFLGALFIISNNNLHIGLSSEREVFFDSYFAWIDSLISHGVEVTGYVVKFEWLPIEEDLEPGPISNFFDKE